MKKDYVHGYSLRENSRLVDQATTLTELLHSDTHYPAGSRVLEAGCGVGAQTVTLARNSPHANIISVDISEDSLNAARKRVEAEGITNVTFQQADIFNLSFDAETFDYVFVCFVLEHLADPVNALLCVKSMLKHGGSITVIEGDHGSVYFHPENSDARRAIHCQIDIQARAGGNALIGREVYPLLVKADFKDISVSPRMVYVDSSKPEWVEGFTKKTFTAMIEGVQQQAISLGLIDDLSWQKGIQALYRTAESDGTFCYTFFKGVGFKGIAG